MKQEELFKNKSQEELYSLMNDLIRRGLDHSNLSLPTMKENKDLLIQLNKRNDSLKRTEQEIRFLAVKHWYDEGGIVDDKLGYRIANLASDEAIHFALDIVGPHAIGKSGQSIATRIFSRFPKAIVKVINHPNFDWNKENPVELIKWVFNKKSHSALSHILKSDVDVFELIKEDKDRNEVLKQMVVYLDNSIDSAILNYNCGRIVDILYEKQWNLDTVKSKLDNSNSVWGRQLKSILEESWMNDNAVINHNVKLNSLKF